MKTFLILTSIIEGATGLALLTIPSLVIPILLGSEINDSITILITRIAGVALISIAIACWFSRNDGIENKMIIATFFYNIASIALLGYAGLIENLIGIALWPAVVAHIGMAIWGAKFLRL